MLRPKLELVLNLRVVVTGLVCASLVACGSDQTPGATKVEGADATAGPAVAVVADPAALKAAASIPWVHDEAAKARGQAASSKRPLVIDMWAPWCHTCLSMQDTVLKDPALAARAKDFVWLAADTDKAQNAELTAALPMTMWPTFFVVDPTDLTVLSRFAGAASSAQFLAFLDDGRSNYAPGDDGPPPDDPALLLQQALALEAEGKLNEADSVLAQAIGVGGEEWPRLGDSYVERVRLLKKAELFDTCVDVALSGLPSVTSARSASVTDFSYYARGCAAKLESELGKAKARTLRSGLDKALAALDADVEAHLSTDDRSDLLANWRELATAMGDEAKAKSLARRQRDLLKGAWHASEDPGARLTFMWPRAEVAVYLGEGEALVADYEAMVDALPDSYEPPYRLAWLLLQLERPEAARPHALAAVDRLYGPRKARALNLLIEVEAAAGDPAAQRKARVQLIELHRSLPAGQRDPKALRKAGAELQSFDRAFGTVPG